MGPSLSSAARACPSPTTTGKALPKRAPASPEAVRAFVRKRAEEFLGVGSEEHVSSSLRRLVRAQTRALERSLDRETDDRLGAGAASEDDVEFGDAASRHRLDGARAHPFPDETLDVLFRRRLLLLQARRGYRCNVDSLLLAAHAAEALRGRVSSLRGHQSPRVADLGAGCGVVGLAVALDRSIDRSATRDAPNDDDVNDVNDSSPYELPEVNSVNTRDTTTRDTRVLSIERQASLASRCARNAALNGLSRRVEVWRGDVVDVADAARAREFSKLAPWLRSCDAVVVNPPYYEMDSARAAGTQPRETERRDAHYETTATLLDFARAAEALLAPEEEEDFTPETRRADETNETKKTRNAPTAHFVYPAARAASVAAACAAAGLGDVTIKRVFTDERVRASNGDPALALIDARRALRAERDPERDPERRRIEARRADASGVLYADDARRTYGADVETFMENLGL
jgi:tRNA1(Val) A37 N6-methylase TrmN6